MIQTLENGKKKTDVEPDFDPFGPNLGHQTFFCRFLLYL